MQLTDDEVFVALELQLGCPPNRTGEAAFYNELTRLIPILLPHIDLPTLVTIRRLYYQRYGMHCFDVIGSPARGYPA